MLKLQFKDRRRESVWLVDQTFTIGKHTDNSLMINDARLEDRHAELQRRQDALVLVNVSAGTGVWVNGMPVGDEVKVAAGDEITLGDVALLLVDPKQIVAPANVSTANQSGWAISSKASWLEQNRYSITDQLVIGRDPQCDICIPLDHLSRRHVELAVRNGQLVVKDLDSSNGTYVNGERVSEVTVKNGDKIKLDVVTFDVIGPAHDPHKTIIRTAPAATATPPKPSATADSGTAKPAAQRTGAQNKTANKAQSKPLPNRSPKKKKLVADGKQDWLQSNATTDSAPDKSRTGLYLFCAAIIVGGIAAAILL